MRCPFCNEDEDRVIDSRQSREAVEIRRRRECLRCSRRFTTYERIEEALPAVVKADGRREPFDRNKIERGLVRAVGKRPVSAASIAEVAEAIEREVAELAVKEVLAVDIGSRVLPLLRQLDEVSYVRYASIYRDFRDLAEFERELNEVIKARS